MTVITVCVKCGREEPLEWTGDPPADPDNIPEEEHCPGGCVWGLKDVKD